jgi:large subunit ribosomal protein L3
MMQAMIGRKIGMTQLFQETGEVGVTAIEAGPCVVTQVKTVDKDGYNAIQVGFGETKKLKSAQKGHLKGLGSLRYLHEFRVEDTTGIEVAQKIDVDIFKPGDRINVIGISKGKGFAGGVKRYHFSGGPKTHGQSDRHRAPGSIGASATPGRVLKGQRMAGHMGNRRVTERKLEVIAVDSQRNMLLVKGAVPGARKGILYITKAN